MMIELNEGQMQTLIGILSKYERQEVKDLMYELRCQIPVIDFYERVQELKALERSELKKILKLFGTQTETGYVRKFSDSDFPVIAGYCHAEPCDIIVHTVDVDKDDNLTIIGECQTDRGYWFNVNLDDIFAGQRCAFSFFQSDSAESDFAKFIGLA